MLLKKCTSCCFRTWLKHVFIFLPLPDSLMNECSYSWCAVSVFGISLCCLFLNLTPARPDRSGWWDNRMVAHTCPEIQCGLAVDWNMGVRRNVSGGEGNLEILLIRFRWLTMQCKLTLKNALSFLPCYSVLVEPQFSIFVWSIFYTLSIRNAFCKCEKKVKFAKICHL